jgi:hypothetical protein
LSRSWSISQPAVQQPGFVEIDLVGHEGGDNNGNFASSLTLTDIETGWTEVRATGRRRQRSWMS